MCTKERFVQHVQEVEKWTGKTWKENEYIGGDYVGGVALVLLIVGLLELLTFLLTIFRISGSCCCPEGIDAEARILAQEQYLTKAEREKIFWFKEFLVKRLTTILLLLACIAHSCGILSVVYDVSQYKKHALEIFWLYRRT